MDISNDIALLSCMAAFLAALYARWTVTAARYQNKIAIHNEQLKIFKSFLDFRAKLTAYGTSISERDLYLELFSQVQLAEFYYKDTAYYALSTFFNDLREMIELRHHAELTKDTETINKKHSKLDECRKAAKHAEESMKSELRLAKTPLSLSAKFMALIQKIKPSR